MHSSVLSALAASLVVTLTGARALACGALPSPIISFAATVPSDGARDVVRDAPVVLRFGCEFESDEVWIVREAACQVRSEEIAIVVSAPDGAAVPGGLVRYQDAILFVPASPLAADTAYAVQATYAPPGREDVLTNHRFSFQTGSRMLPPFVAVEPFALEVGWYDAPVARCGGAEYVGTQAEQQLGPQICPTGCERSGTRRLPRIVAKAGPFGGGAMGLPYAVELSMQAEAVPPSALFPIDAREPPWPAHTHLAYVTPLNRQELTVDLPQTEDESHPLCVRVQASDGAGHVLVGAEECRTRREWLALAPRDPTGDAAVAPLARPHDASSATRDDASQVDAAAADDAPRTTPEVPPRAEGEPASRESEGCQASTRSSPGGALALLLVLLVAHGHRARSRRS